MKFFGWMQNKLSVKQVNRQNTAAPSQNVAREEFSDWPQGLLAIGTFGNNGLKENAEIQEEVLQSEPSEAQEEVLEDSFTQEEVGKLQKELTKLLSRTKKRKSDVHKELANLPLDRFLNCPSSLEVDRRISNAICSADSEDKEEDIERTISVILGRCKEIRSVETKKKKDVAKKSVSLLLKKLFVCADGFAPTPSLRDTLQESRMEKLLRMMLHKKIINQQSSSSSSRGSAMKKYLEDRQTQNQNKTDENEEKVSQGKWVKTDSDCKFCQSCITTASF